MNKKVKFLMFAGLLVLLMACSSQGSALGGGTSADEQITIRFSFVNAPMSIKALAANKFAELAYEKTEGRVKVEVYPGAQLYDDDESIDAIVGGNLEMIAPSVTKMVRFDPRWQYVDMPFLFEDEEHVLKFFESDIARDLFQSEILENNHLMGMVFWQNGFKQFTSTNKPLRAPDDFKGMNFRVQAGSVLEATYQAIGAGTATLSLGETYAALQQGTVDGTENTFNNIDTQNYEEVQDYLTVSNHGRIDWAVFVNKPFWESMPSEVREQVEEALFEATDYMNAIAQEENDKSFQKIKEGGNIEIFQLTESQRQEFHQAFDAVYDEFESIITRELIEGIRGLK
ncbi:MULTISPECIES: DctP family TRAP transporter solute-binding subunit [Bacillaceae]|uniref:DctP family TRAP transporter solute-binding subunit n=1 Tax=Evansella alkalicola TaxID=745819 RepID=A0ABS6JQS7_9BACI|nr:MULTISPECIES: DctP family TRAP transporter solute-binding subunit [Bacillaceae]MBU9720890.1 DctP family TRAP transporter solute-binding subunit [Bacillus alkalicola]